jgi:hypothetical protein
MTLRKRNKITTAKPFETMGADIVNLSIVILLDGYLANSVVLQTT